jgi:GNAT superfamily N-acetyltransferase
MPYGKTVREIRKIYVSSFPKNELRPFGQMMGMVKSRRAGIILAKRSGKVAGFVIFHRLKGCILVEYAAVAKGARGTGIGSALLAKLAKKAKRMVMELEPPKTKKARRRTAFYKRLGFSEVCRDYVQPAYSAKQKPVRLRLFANFRPGNVKTLVTEIHRKVYGKD